MGSIPPGFRALPVSIAQLSLAAVLKCGQSFRWSIYPLYVPSSPGVLSTSTMQPSHEYRLCLKDRVVCLRQNHETLFYRDVFPDASQTEEQDVMRAAQTLAWLRDYFQLDVDLLELYEQWSKRDPVFASLKDRFGGIRMLRQDPWENLIS
jgi:N-glycosylase/DNA lyase